MKGKDGSTLTAEREQVNLCEVLNHPQPDEPADPHQHQMTSNINTRPPKEAEV